MMDKMSCGEKGAKMGLQGTVGRAQNMIDDTFEHLGFPWKALPASSKNACLASSSRWGGQGQG